MKCCVATLLLARHRPMTVGRMQIALGEHSGPRKTRQDSSSLGSAAQRLTLSRYVARLKPRCGSLALSVMWYVLTVSILSVNIHSKSYKVHIQCGGIFCAEVREFAFWVFIGLKH
jgi:hypothetical protein